MALFRTLAEFAEILFALVSAASALDFASRKDIRFVGVPARSDGQTLSIQLCDTRIVRFRLDRNTRYSPAGGSAKLAAFRIADFVEVKAEAVDFHPAAAQDAHRLSLAAKPAALASHAPASSGPRRALGGFRPGRIGGEQFLLPATATGSDIIATAIIVF